MKNLSDVPYSNYRLTVRLELENQPGVFASMAALLAKEKLIGALHGIIDHAEKTWDMTHTSGVFDWLGDQFSKKAP